MSRPLLSLCSTPQQAMRDGYVGAYAKVLVPFLSYYYFANGMQVTPNGGTAPQPKGNTLGGHRMPNNYTKYGSCC